MFYLFLNYFLNFYDLNVNRRAWPAYLYDSVHNITLSITYVLIWCKNNAAEYILTH